MHHAKMHIPDLRAVVVDDGHGGVLYVLDGNLLHQFTPHAVLITTITGKKTVVFL